MYKHFESNGIQHYINAIYHKNRTMKYQNCSQTFSTIPLIISHFAESWKMELKKNTSNLAISHFICLLLLLFFSFHFFLFTFTFTMHIHVAVSVNAFSLSFNFNWIIFLRDRFCWHHQHKVVIYHLCPYYVMALPESFDMHAAAMQSYGGCVFQTKISYTVYLKLRNVIQLRDEYRVNFLAAKTKQ